MKKITWHRSVNETIVYYFSKNEINKYPCDSMDKKRMNQIFDEALKSKSITAFNVNRIKDWKKINNLE